MNFPLCTSLLLKTHPTTLLAIVAVLSTSGCSNERRVRPPAPVKAAVADEEKSFGTAEGPRPRRRTREEIREDQAAEKVFENLPDHDMSRDEMVKLVEAAEREIPDAVVDAELRREEKIELNEVEPKSPPSPLPSQRPAEWKKPVTTPSKDTAKVSPPVVRTEPVITSSPTPVTKKESPKEVPKTEPGPPIPGEPTVADNGVDDDDERFASDYTGPKTVVDHPSSSGEYRLSEVAANFGMMRLPKENYSALQKKLMGSSMKACNFFFAAALIEAGAPASDGATATRDHYPAWLAADLDTKYFNSKSAGWERITLVQMKQWFQERRNFDVAIQRDAPPGKKHGHIAIPIGLNADGKVLVAEASYKTVANRIAAYSDVSIATKFRIYARYKKD